MKIHYRSYIYYMNLLIFAQIMKIDNFQTQITENKYLKFQDVMNEKLTRSIDFQMHNYIYTINPNFSPF